MTKLNSKAAKEIRPRGRSWVGAAIVAPGEALGVRRQGPMTFHVWRCPTKRSLYLITGTADLERAALPREVQSIRWVPFKTFPETGLPRIGLSEKEAKRDIAKYGFHLRRITLNTTERVAPPYDMIRPRPKASAA